jgi:hypothetical protein
LSFAMAPSCNVQQRTATQLCVSHIVRCCTLFDTHALRRRPGTIATTPTKTPRANATRIHARRTVTAGPSPLDQGASFQKQAAIKVRDANLQKVRATAPYPHSCRPLTVTQGGPLARRISSWPRRGFPRLHSNEARDPKPALHLPMTFPA